SLKLFISKRGIYKLDYDMLKGSGIDPSKIDPRTLKITYKGSEIPIYVYGESDGKFDKEDYIEFFGVEAKNIYTRWNIYWLSWGGNKGIRMTHQAPKKLLFSSLKSDLRKTVFIISFKILKTIQMILILGLNPAIIGFGQVLKMDRQRMRLQ
ncbi:MAG: hypothetical protein ACPL7B_15355, partial [Candidatus Poribacteria bacterium]